VVVTRVLLVVALALGATACSVPSLSLDGKQCPCTDGYVCDTLTNRCLATNDGGGIIDTPAATQCLAAATETELYRYAGTYDWQSQGGTWGGDANEITQSSTSAQDAFAYRSAANLGTAANVRVIASMREIASGPGSPSLGIVLRAQLSDKSHYSCDWSAKDRQLRIDRYGSSGTPTTIGAAAISPARTLPSSFTMEAAITGSSVSCCIRELPDAKLVDIPDTTAAIAMGFPGLDTTRLQAAFGSFVVFQRP
jgi:hypothetical protein